MGSACFSLTSFAPLFGWHGDIIVKGTIEGMSSLDVDCQWLTDIGACCELRPSSGTLAYWSIIIGYLSDAYNLSLVIVLHHV